MMIEMQLIINNINKQLKGPIDIGYQEQVSNHPSVLFPNGGGIERMGSKGEHESLR
jgi:hypothetical protein